MQQTIKQTNKKANTPCNPWIDHWAIINSKTTPHPNNTHSWGKVLDRLVQFIPLFSKELSLKEKVMGGVKPTLAPSKQIHGEGHGSHVFSTAHHCIVRLCPLVCLRLHLWCDQFHFQPQFCNLCLLLSNSPVDSWSLDFLKLAPRCECGGVIRNSHMLNPLYHDMFFFKLDNGKANHPKQLKQTSRCENECTCLDPCSIQSSTVNIVKHKCTLKTWFQKLFTWTKTQTTECLIIQALTAFQFKS